MKKEAVPRGIAFVLYAHRRHLLPLRICFLSLRVPRKRNEAIHPRGPRGLLQSLRSFAMTKTFSARTRNGAKVFSWNAQWRKSFQLDRAMTKTFSAGTRNGAKVFSWNAQWRKNFQLKRAMTKTFSAGTRNGAKVFSWNACG